MHVTANGYVGDTCNIKHWGTGSVRVKCLDSDGDPTQSQFAATFNSKALLSSRAGGHTWVSGGNPSPWYSAAQSTLACGTPGTFSATSAGLDLDVSLSDTYFPPSSWSDYVPMVTSYGSNDNACKVVFWSAPGNGYRARVRCFDGAGTQISAASTAFTLSFTDNGAPGPC